MKGFINSLSEAVAPSLELRRSSEDGVESRGRNTGRDEADSWQVRRSEMEVDETQVWITSRAPGRRGKEHTEGERGDTGETRMRRRIRKTGHSPSAGLPLQHLDCYVEIVPAKHIKCSTWKSK